MIDKYIASGLFHLYLKHGKYIGDAVLNDDGFWVFFPSRDNGGYFSQEILLGVGKYLEEKNQDWQRHINEYFAKKKS